MYEKMHAQVALFKILFWPQAVMEKIFFFKKKKRFAIQVMQLTNICHRFKTKYFWSFSDFRESFVQFVVGGKSYISRKDLWEIEAERISFPSSTSLHQLLDQALLCPLCLTFTLLSHIPIGCKVSFSQGRYTQLVDKNPGRSYWGKKISHQCHSLKPLPSPRHYPSALKKN